jgi:DNA-binding NtrC family response regulator
MEGRILVVDDEPYQLLYLEKALQTLGYQVKGVKSAAEVLALLRAERFDLLMTDLYMPDVDGFALVGEARKLDPELSIFVITALKSMSNLTEAMKAGADGYILKPIEIELMRHVLGREFRVRALRAENRALKAGGKA